MVVGRSHVAGLATAAAVLTVAAAFAQQNSQHTPQQPPLFRAGVNAVRVDVSVTDHEDRPITGLTASDFELTEDGVPQKIDTVQFLRLDGRPAPGSDELLDINTREDGEQQAARDDVRVFAVFLDDYHIERQPPISIPLQKALVHFVDALGPTDVVALMHPLTSLDDVQFTRSHSDLEAIMREFEGRQGDSVPRSPAEEAQMMSGDPGRLRAQVSLSALEALVTYLGGLKEGRKTVIYVSEGPRLAAESDLNDDVERVIRAANQGNVTIDTMDPRGLGDVSYYGDDVPDRLAEGTGGRAIVNTNDLASGLDRVIADASAYYMLGYTPARDLNDGRFHRIQVRVAPRGAHVVARRGYWAPSAAEVRAAATLAEKPVEPGLPGALSEMAPSGEDRLVDVWLGWSRGAPGRTTLTVAWDSERALEGAHAVTRLLVQPLVKEGGAALADGQTFPASDVATFDLAPATVALHVAALDAKGETVDEWTQPLTVPNLSVEPLVLATPRFVRARSEFEYRAVRTNAKVTPTAARRFDDTDHVFVDVQCYWTGDAVPRLTAKLQNDQGRTLIELPMPPLADGRTRFEIPLPNLAPSRYVVKIQASAADQHAEQLVAFRVGP
jgi:VWFA-related protein